MQKETLLKALEIVKPGLANKEMIEQSTSFAFMSGRVVTYNDEISISHPVEGLDIEGAIKAEELYGLLSKLKEGKLELKKTDEEITISYGDGSSAAFNVKSEIKLPLDEIGERKKWHNLPEGFTDGLSFCLFSCSRDMSRPVLTCLHIRKDGIIESCDNVSLTHYDQKQEMPISTFLIPQSSAQQLIKYPITEIAEGEGWVHFKTEEGTMFSCRIFQDEYPDTSKVIEIKGKDIPFPDSMDCIIDRVSVFSKRDESFTTEEAKITLKNGQMVIKAQSNTGRIEEKIKIEYKGEIINFSINPQLLRKILPRIKKGILEETKIAFIGENWKHVITLIKTDD